MPSKSWCIITLACVAGCFEYTPPDGWLRCASDQPACPDGYYCAGDNHCHRPGFDGPPPTSCLALPATCGPEANAPCCESLLVSGGTFYRSHDVAPDMAYPDINFPATLSTFRLDRYEVTVGRFRKFVASGQGTQVNPPAAGAGAHERIVNSGWDVAWNASLAADATALIAQLKCEATYPTWTDSPSANENLPVNCITWYQAMAFCAWDGGRLPTEAESMYAASGGSLQRAYPWSSPAGSTTIDCTLANYGGATWPTTACVSSGLNTVGSESPQGDGVWGQADLAGNVWEWVLDWFATLPAPCTDCANLIQAPYRVVRGGSFVRDASYLRAAYRTLGDPVVSVGFGFRCARAVP